MARLHSQGARVLFFFSSAQDDKDSRQMIAVANQGGLGLPDRDYYTKDDARSKQLRDQIRPARHEDDGAGRRRPGAGRRRSGAP